MPRRSRNRRKKEDTGIDFNLGEIPEDIMPNIFSFIDYETATKLAQTSRDMRRYAEEVKEAYWNDLQNNDFIDESKQDRFVLDIGNIDDYRRYVDQWGYNESYITLDPNLEIDAIRYNRPDILEFIEQLGGDLNYQGMLLAAAQYGRVDIIEDMLDDTTKHLLPEMLLIAAQHGQFAAIKAIVSAADRVPGMYDALVEATTIATEKNYNKIARYLITEVFKPKWKR